MEVTENVLHNTSSCLQSLTFENYFLMENKDLKSRFLNVKHLVIFKIQVGIT